MKFTECPLAGAYVIETEPIRDERGFLARIWCRKEFDNFGLSPLIEQSSISFNHRKGTLRGMHFQAAPHEEVKLVRCTQGAIYDVILDLRSDSPTYLRWFAEQLSAENRKLLYIPPGFAHGFQTLAEHSEVCYQMSEAYYPELSRGVRWNDPEFQIKWPIPDPIISERDRSFPDFVDSSEKFTAVRQES